MSNFLPQKEKGALAANYYQRVATTSLLLVFFLVVLGCVFLIPAFVALSWTNYSIDQTFASASERVKALEDLKIEEGVRVANAQITLLRKREGGPFLTSDVMGKISSLVNPFVSIAGMSVDASSASSDSAGEMKIYISGRARDRQSFLLFVGALEKEREMFSRVDSPITNLIKGRDLNFSVFVYTLRN